MYFKIEATALSIIQQKHKRETKTKQKLKKKMHSLLMNILPGWKAVCVHTQKTAEHDLFSLLSKTALM